MTGIPTVNDRILFLYELLAFVCIAGFAAYDLKKRRVPDRALLLFLPFALMAPLVRTGLPGTALLPLLFLFSFTGAAAGFLVLLCAAMVSKEGAGIAFVALPTIAKQTNGNTEIVGITKPVLKYPRTIIS